MKDLPQWKDRMWMKKLGRIGELKVKINGIVQEIKKIGQVFYQICYAFGS